MFGQLCKHNLVDIVYISRIRVMKPVFQIFQKGSFHIFEDSRAFDRYIFMLKLENSWLLEGVPVELFLM